MENFMNRKYKEDNKNHKSKFHQNDLISFFMKHLWNNVKINVIVFLLNHSCL